MKNTRGRLIARAKTGRWWVDSRKGQIEWFLAFLSMFCTSLFLIFLSYLEIIHGYVESSFCWGSTGIIFSIIGFLGFFVMSFSFDEIYENGVSSSLHNLKDFIMGNTFHPYDRITKIGTGERYQEGNKLERIITIYTYDMNKPVTVFLSNRFLDDFFENLYFNLKNHCKHAVWVNASLEDGPFFV